MSENIRIQSELNTDLEVYRLKDELLQLREQNRVLDGALRLVLESWVNGRKVRDGIGQEVLVTVEAALTATSQEGEHESR